MFRVQRLHLPWAAALLASPAAGQPPPACGSGPAAAVSISGLRAPTGLLTVYLWSDDPRAFLAHGRSLQRIELAVNGTEPTRLCLAAPRPGRYAVSVRHDMDGNRRRYDMNDGGGFSRNPRLTLTRPRPPLETVLIDIGADATRVDVVMNYRFGMSIRPVTRPPARR